MALKSNNPVMGEKVFQRTAVAGEQVMTIGGTINKSLISVLLTLLSGYFAWQADNSMLMWIGLGGGFVVALVTVFNSRISPYTTPVYAIFEGLFLGMISKLIPMYYGAADDAAGASAIVAQAILGTGITFFVMLVLYRTRVIKVTETFRSVVIAATLGIATVYLIFFIMSFFGHTSFLATTTPLSIGVTAVIAVVAALNLALDFDMIERLEQSSAPKYMEWYGAFSVLVTLVWLYIEILRLISKISSRN